MLLWPPPTLAQTNMYRWTDADGRLHYEDRPPAQGPYEQTPLTAPATAPEEATGLRPGERRLLQQLEHDRRRAATARKSQARAAEQERRRQAQEAERRRNRCEAAKRQLQAVERRLTAGYPINLSYELHARQESYREQVKEYCD